MNYTAAQVIAQAATDLQDPSNVQWSAAFLLAALNRARNRLFLVRPKFYETTEEMALAAGYRQTLPNGSNRLFGVIENTSHPKRRAVTPVTRDIVDQFRSSWRAGAQKEEVQHSIYTDQEPTVFEVFPPVKAGTTVRISYAKPPTEITDTATVLSAERELASALPHFIVADAYLRAGDVSDKAVSMAQTRLTLWNQAIGDDLTTSAMTNPNDTADGARPIRLSK